MHVVALAARVGRGVPSVAAVDRCALSSITALRVELEPEFDVGAGSLGDIRFTECLAETLAYFLICQRSGLVEGLDLSGRWPCPFRMFAHWSNLLFAKALQTHSRCG